MNPKSFLLITLFIYLSGQLGFSQDTLNPQWVITESSPLNNGNAEAWAIGTDLIGNLYWGVNKDMPGLFEYMDAFIYKMDDENNLIWLDTVSTGIFAQQSYNLKVTDSLIYIAGRTCSTVGVESCDVLFATTNKETGSTGWEFVWDGGFGYEEIDGIALEPDGIYITGWSAGDGTNIDVLLMKIDYSGNLIWQTTWGSPGARDDHQDGHMVMDDSLIYISGLYDGSPGLGWDGYALLAKFDRINGEFVDSILYGRQDPWFNAENALGMTTDGTHLFVTGYTTVSPNNWDIFVAKFDKNLNEIWYTTWGGVEHAESSRALVVAPDGSIYVGGTTESFGNGEMDVVLLKLDPDGEPMWYKTWGRASDDQILDVYLHDKNLYMTGKTKSFHPSQKWEALLLKVEIDSMVSAIALPNEIREDIYFSPNPMVTSSTLKFSNPGNQPHILNIFNLKGEKVRTLRNIRSEEISIEKKEFTSGIFFYQLVNNLEVITSGKLIIN